MGYQKPLSHLYLNLTLLTLVLKWQWNKFCVPLHVNPYSPLHYIASESLVSLCDSVWTMISIDLGHDRPTAILNAEKYLQTICVANENLNAQTEKYMHHNFTRINVFLMTILWKEENHMGKVASIQKLTCTDSFKKKNNNSCMAIGCFL